MPCCRRPRSIVTCLADSAAPLCHHGPRFHPSPCRFHRQVRGNQKATHTHMSFRCSIQNDTIQRRKRGYIFPVSLFRMEETFFRNPPADFSLCFIGKDWIVSPFLNQCLERDLADWLRLVIWGWRGYWNLSQYDHL